MHPLARVCSNGMPSVFCRRRAWRAWRGGVGNALLKKGQGHHTYHSPGITRVVPPALSWCCARRLAGA